MALSSSFLCHILVSLRLKFIVSIVYVRCGNMQKQLFRQYDIRGKIGTEISPDDFYYLAHATIHFLQQQGPLLAIVLGMDGRVHSQALYQEIAAACKIAGIDVYYLGVCSTPITTFAHYQLPVQASFMITASHNPADYNGLKISYQKIAVEGEKLQQIYDLFVKKTIVQGDRLGVLFDATEMTENYVATLFEQFSHLKNFSQPCFIDCGNGTAGPIVEKLIQKMGWKNVQLLFKEVDGTYPNHTADPTDMKNMTFLYETLHQNPGSFGVGLDGDCDRVAVITATQGLVSADRLLTLFAQAMQAHVVIADIKSSTVLQVSGAQIILVATGCANIIEAMHEYHAVIGGELSGHFFFRDRHDGYDDGIYTMLRYFEMLMQKNIDCDTLVATLPELFSTKDIRIPCPDIYKFQVVQEIKTQLIADRKFKITTVDGVRFETLDGWALIRAANTQPMISVCCQASSPEKLREMKSLLILLLQPYIEIQILEQYIL